MFKSILLIALVCMFTGCFSTTKYVYVTQKEDTKIEIKKDEKRDKDNSIVKSFSEKLNLSFVKKEENSSLFGLAYNHFNKE